MSSVQALATPAPPLDSCASEPAPKRQCQMHRSTMGDFAKWLLDIAPQRTLMPYVTAIHREFSHISELLHLVIKPHEAGQPVLDCLEPGVWDTLGIQKLGHKLLFAHGVLALHREDLFRAGVEQSSVQQTATGDKLMQGPHPPPTTLTPHPPPHPPPPALLASAPPGAKPGPQAEEDIAQQLRQDMRQAAKAEWARRLASAPPGAKSVSGIQAQGIEGAGCREELLRRLRRSLQAKQ